MTMNVLASSVRVASRRVVTSSAARRTAVSFARATAKQQSSSNVQPLLAAAGLAVAASAFVQQNNEVRLFFDRQGRMFMIHENVMSPATARAGGSNAHVLFIDRLLTNFFVFCNL